MGISTSLLVPALIPGCAGKGQPQSTVASSSQLTPTPTATCTSRCPRRPFLLNPVRLLLTDCLSASPPSFSTPSGTLEPTFSLCQLVLCEKQPIGYTRGRPEGRKMEAWQRSGLPAPARTRTPRTCLSACALLPQRDHSTSQVMPLLRHLSPSSVECLLKLLGSDDVSVFPVFS